jgi:lipoyl(octanoyl) transferase
MHQVHSKQRVRYRDLGLVSYEDTWKLQTQINTSLKEQKRNGGAAPVHELLFCEHPPVYTLGKSGTEAHLKLNESELNEKNIEYFKINRGGDITYHGPGQIVGYPIFDLDYFFTDVHRYVRSLEEAVIRTLAEYGITAGRVAEYTGVWIDFNSLHPRKICAIGVHMSRWVTMHGFAFNVNTDLAYYSHIVPCGIDTSQKPVTSMERELGNTVDITEVRLRLKAHFADIFDFQYLED